MKESDQHRVTRWIDGELTDEDIRDLLELHPELHEEKDAAHRVGDLLRQELPADAEVPNAEFFNDSILREAIEEEPYPQGGPAQMFPIFERMKWIALAGCAAMVLALCGIGINAWNTAADGRNEIISAYTPNPNHEASVEYNGAADATVMTLSGLDAVPQSNVVIGFFPKTSETNRALASTTYYTEDGEPILVLTVNAFGLPTIRPINL